MTGPIRAVGFLAERNYPPGNRRLSAGPFKGEQERFSGLLGNHCKPAAIAFSGTGINPALPNGITIFPGAFGLYRNGVLIGAIGVSCDGVDQDDIIESACGVLPGGKKDTDTDRNFPLLLLRLCGSRRLGFARCLFSPS